ncbi:MAG: thioredoxin-dependent thiol peroxidase [Candidatus Micrarchaeota archaeon]|nr:thioredoxin-dependent thiol peroxidase [Candidatus Micrarchaeota archaeon]
MLKAGEEAPDFELSDSGGRMVKLSSFRGRRVVLYFYPKDDTPGCTAEACGFRDMSREFERRGAAIVGVSPDSEKSHAAFSAKYGLSFTLLSDSGARVAKKYGVLAEKKVQGKKTMGIKRTTFVIGADGRIEKVFENVKPEGHEKEVLGWLGGD